jgi:acetyl esterase/lipase
MSATPRHISICWALAALTLVAGCAWRSEAPQAASPARVMAPGELQAIPSRPPDHRVAYGPEPSQYGELRIPSGSGPHPVVVLVHGGCFKAAYATLRDLAPMGDALKAVGIATWNIEYRRAGEPGGGWPGTYLDVARAIDHLRVIAGLHQLDLDRLVMVGHSAGGHLAMWAAARARVPQGSVIGAVNPLRTRGVINLAGPVDLTANIAGYESLCRDTVITGLLGGTPATVPERYAQASPIKLLPTGTLQVLLWGEHEDFVPRPLAEAYVRAATQSGDQVRLIVIPGVGHFETASPRSTTWPRVESVIRTLLDGRMPVD